MHLRHYQLTSARIQAQPVWILRTGLQQPARTVTEHVGLPAARHSGYSTRNFYQVKPISEILFRQGVFPADTWGIDDPASFFLAEEAHGM